MCRYGMVGFFGTFCRPYLAFTFFFFFSSRRRHTRCLSDWSSDVCSSDLSTARAHVAGLEAVLADGAVVSRLSGLTKDNAGYDLPALLVGSEGTLAIITRVRWRLAPLLRSRVAALVPLSSVAAAADLLATLRECAPSLESCDFFFDDGLQLVLRHQRRHSPISEPAPIYVLAECAAASDPTDELAV